MTLPQNSSIAETKTQMDRLEAAGRRPRHRALEFLCRPGRRALLSAARRAARQSVLRPGRDRDQGIEARGRVAAAADRSSLRAQFVGIDILVHALELGPPVGRPVQYRLSGPDIQTVRSLGAEIRRRDRRKTAMSAASSTTGTSPRRCCRSRSPGSRAPTRHQLAGRRLDAEQRGRRLGHHPGARQHLPDRRRSDAPRMSSAPRSRPSRTCSFPAATISRCRCPPFATIGYELEQPLVWRRDRQPTITLKAGVAGDVQPATVVVRT